MKHVSLILTFTVTLLLLSTAYGREALIQDAHFMEEPNNKKAKAFNNDQEEKKSNGKILGVIPKKKSNEKKIADQKWKDDLIARLKNEYVLTEKAGPLRISKTGTIFVIQIEQLTSDLSSDMTIRINKIIDGQVKTGRGFLTTILVQDKQNARNFRTGDRVYMTTIDVKDNNIVLFIITCDMYEVNVNGNTQQARYVTALDFQFPKNYLATASAENVKGVIEAVLKPEQGLTIAGPKKIEIGQTPAEVESIVGSPEQIIELGSKKIYVYKNMKITFINGKLSDVQ